MLCDCMDSTVISKDLSNTQGRTDNSNQFKRDAIPQFFQTSVISQKVDNKYADQPFQQGKQPHNGTCQSKQKQRNADHAATCIQATARNMFTQDMKVCSLFAERSKVFSRGQQQSVSYLKANIGQFSG